MAASMRKHMGQFIGAACWLTTGLVNIIRLPQAHSHHRFGVWSKQLARKLDDEPGSKPRKIEWINVEKSDKNMKKGGKKTPTFVFGDGIVAGILQTLQKRYDFSAGSIARWFWRKRHEHMVRTQSVLRQEWTFQGVEIAAAYFVVSLDGGVLFAGQREWIRKKNTGDLVFPNHSPIGFNIDAIDLSGAEILYEGLCHFEQLKKVQWLSLRNCPYVDDWFLDRVSCVFRHSLIFLDIRDCQQITEKGLSILHRLKCSDDLNALPSATPQTWAIKVSESFWLEEGATWATGVHAAGRCDASMQHFQALTIGIKRIMMLRV